MPLPSPKRAALCLALMSPVLATTACSSSAPKPAPGWTVGFTNNDAADASILGCPPDVCGSQSRVNLQAGTDVGWTEPRTGIAYTVTVLGSTSACPPVLRRDAGSRNVYFVITKAGNCELGTPPS